MGTVPVEKARRAHHDYGNSVFCGCLIFLLLATNCPSPARRDELQHPNIWRSTFIQLGLLGGVWTESLRWADLGV